MPQQLVHHLLIIRMDLRDHVTRNEAKPGTGLPTVEAICVFVSIYLESSGVGRWGEGKGGTGASDRPAQPHVTLLAAESPKVKTAENTLFKPHPSPASVTSHLDQ